MMDGFELIAKLAINSNPSIMVNFYDFLLEHAKFPYEQTIVAGEITSSSCCCCCCCDGCAARPSAGSPVQAGRAPLEQLVFVDRLEIRVPRHAVPRKHRALHLVLHGPHSKWSKLPYAFVSPDRQKWRQGDRKAVARQRTPQCVLGKAPVARSPSRKYSVGWAKLLLFFPPRAV